MLEWNTLLDELELGKVRTASQSADGTWVIHTEVKQAILQAFKEGDNISYEGYVDKHTLLPRKFGLKDEVRIVPGGSHVRRGAYIARGVIIMPPSYVNIGAYIDEGCMVDSHVLVGSCAQIGKGVHLSAGVKIGGVLEPIGQQPVIIEDHVFIGAGAVVVEGMLVKKGAVIAPAVALSKSVQIYDAVNECILEKGSDVPSGAVLVPGTRPLKGNVWAEEHQIGIYTPVIIKYRDQNTTEAISLEEALR